MQPTRCDTAQYWRPPAIGTARLGGVQLLKACFIEYEYARHSHPEYAIGVIENGVQTFWSNGAQQFAPAGSGLMLPPGEVHDGMAAIRSGYRYRMLYVDPHVVQAVADQLHEGGEPAFVGLASFVSPVVQDPELASSLVELHQLLEPENAATACPLDVETRLLAVLTRLLRRHARENPALRPVQVEVRRSRQAIDFMRERLAQKISLRQLAEFLDISPYHFVRSFRRQVGLPPHAYLTQLRLDEARRLIRAGVPLAEVALRVGFANQSHLSNRFKAAYGYTPGTYRRATVLRGSRGRP